MNASAFPLSPIESVDMGERVRDAADRNRSAVSQPRASTGTGLREAEALRFTKLEEYHRQTRPAERAIVAVRRLRRYGAGWDGYGADAPSEVSIRDAVEFLSRTVSGAHFQVDIDTDGIVSLAIDKGDARLLLTFEGNGQVIASRKCDSAWSEIGIYPIRGELGRTSPAVERLIEQL